MNTEIKLPKKRGRKPKGGKIVEQKKEDVQKNDVKVSVILHLKCKKSDIKTIENNYDPIIHNIEPYSNDETQYEIIPHNPVDDTQDSPQISSIDKEKKIIYDKLSDLESNLHLNNIIKKSDCFWCTCSYDTPIIYIPKKHVKDKYEVYGCFCSPECATGYLFNEHISDAIKFERFQLMNHIYGKIYDYKEVIKIAPNPYYTLDKYYGNLNIQEYRKLLKYDRLLLFTEKPLTKIYPELHEDNVLFEPLYNNKMIMKKNIRVNKKTHIQNAFQI